MEKEITVRISVNPLSGRQILRFQLPTHRASVEEMRQLVVDTVLKGVQKQAKNQDAAIQKKNAKVLPALLVVPLIALSLLAGKRLLCSEKH